MRKDQTALVIHTLMYLCTGRISGIEEPRSGYRFFRIYKSNGMTLPFTSLLYSFSVDKEIHCIVYHVPYGSYYYHDMEI
jgi:hypothetical protein